MSTEINHGSADHQAGLEAVLDSLLTDITNIRTSVNALVVDMTQRVSQYTVMNTKVSALYVDMTSRVSEYNVLIAKLNSDGGVSDTNYVSAVSQTTATAPAAASQTAAAVTTLGTTT